MIEVPVAADKLHLSTPAKLSEGLEKLLNASQGSSEPRKKQVYALWTATVTKEAPEVSIPASAGGR